MAMWNSIILLRGAVVAVLTACVGAGTAIAGKADVVGIKIRKTSDGLFSFDVTVKHDDTGWTHYADRWDVVAPDGRVLGTRKLLHPHEDEQPFTRSLSGVRIPAEIATVSVRAHDKLHGEGGAVKTVKVPH